MMSELTGPAAATGIDWSLADPANAGFSGELNARLDQAIANKRVWNLHGVIIMRNCRIALERYFGGVDNARGRPLGNVAFTSDTLHDMRSVTKSIVCLLYGIALSEGKVPAPDAPLFGSFAEYPDLAADPQRGRWTVEHVLTMTIGTDWDELSVPYTDPTNDEIAMDNSPDRYRYVLDRPVVLKPGERWIYNGGATALLGKLIAKGTNKPLQDYAKKVLFDPLGIAKAEWFYGREGDATAASGLRITARDLATIGRLMLSGGALNGQQIVPASWIKRITTPFVRIDEVRHYGYQWYLGHWSFVMASAPRWDRRRIESFWSAIGNGGQRLFVFPGLDLAVVTTCGNYDAEDQWIPPTNLINEVVLPCIV